MSAIQSIYVALFGRPADPGGLAYWTEVTNNGADLSVMLDTLPSLPEYQARFAGMTNSEIVNSIYLALFGRDAEPDGLAYFVDLLATGAKNLGNIAVTIMQSAQGTDKDEIDAKVAAADLFTAALDTQEEIEAYSGTDAIAVGKAYLDGVTKDKPATQESADGAVKELLPDEGQEPNQPGPTPPVDPVAPTPVDPVPPTPLELAQAEAQEILATWKQLDADYGYIQGKTHGNIALFNNTVEIEGTSYKGYDIPTEISGSPHGTTLGQAAFHVNYANVQNALRYAELITNFPQVALTDEVAKEGGGRIQSVHDNILGSISSVNNIGLPERKFEAETKEEIDAAIAAIDGGAFANRPLFSGHKDAQGGDAHDAVRAFDWARDIDRADGWIDVEYNATIDAAGINMPKGDMYSGSGNLTGNFHVVRHEGAGIEIALKAKPYLKDDGLMFSKLDGDVVVYDVPGGLHAENTARAAWSFDWSITTKMNGAVLPADMDLVLYVDTDRGSGVKLTKVAVGSLLEDHNNDKDLLKEDAPNNVFQNSWNFAFDFLNNMIEGDDYVFGPGLFDIKIAAEIGGVELVANTIRVNVGDFIADV